MVDSIFASKSKADLIQIVRVSGVLPIGKAQKMKKAELVDFLEKQMGSSAKQEKEHIEPSERSDDNKLIESQESPVSDLIEDSKEAISKKTESIKDNQVTLSDVNKVSPKSKRKPRANKETQESKNVSHVNAHDARANAQEKKPAIKNTEPISQVDNSELKNETIAVDDLTAKPRPSKRSRQKQVKAQNEESNNTKQETKQETKEEEKLENREGVLELMPDGYGFLRTDNYIQGPNDIYISAQLIRRMNLRAGDYIKGTVRSKREQDRYQAINFVSEINGIDADKLGHRPHFDRLTPIYPTEKFSLETEKKELSTRIIDLFSPIGKGQRGMVVSPPKAGKTVLLQKIANAISINNPNSKLIVLLIDERPEEVTDMQRQIKGEVVYSTFDKTPENHVKITELVLERAKRLVELGQDVVILLDSMTRMARAYNLTITPTGRTLSGGLDPGALHHPKRFFGAARNIENGGSLTIVATALVETGSRMDEVIFEEFKGTGNMEVVLDRKLSEKRIFPAIDINRSSTRREDLLLTRKELEAVWGVRKAFGQLDTSNVTELIISLLLKTNDNEHLIESLNLSLKDQNMMSDINLPSDYSNSNTQNTSSNGNSGVKTAMRSFQ